MNRVDRTPGVRLITDHPGASFAPPPPPVDLDLSDDDFVPAGLKVWAGRYLNGFAVQGLVDGEGQTYITAAIPGLGLYQTFEVAPDIAADAFEHPFAYGCSLPL